jgi:electron transfer flavoprotein beta subunit
MEIVVLLKQVADTEARVAPTGDGLGVSTGDAKKIINPYDEFAVEEALRIKQAMGGSVTILSAGEQKAAEAIRTALAMGADKGILVSDPAVAESDGLGRAKILAAALKTVPFDLILAGLRAVDDDAFLVGPAVAELLGIPHVGGVLEVSVENGSVFCLRASDSGQSRVSARLPALLTAQKGLNTPRYASMVGIMQAKKKPLQTLALADLGIAPDSVGRGAAKTLPKGFAAPPQRAAGRIIAGETVQEKAANLAKALKNEAKVI